MHRSSRRISLLTAGLTLLLLLVACGKTPATPPGGSDAEPSIVTFTATGLELGEGEWLLSWEAAAESVALNGETVTPTGTRQVPATESTFRLTVRSGATTESAEVTVGPVT